MTINSNIKPITGRLKVGKIAYKGYGFASNNWSSGNNGKNSAFISSDPNLTALGNWGGDDLITRYEGLKTVNEYPHFCKLYVNNSLVFIGEIGHRCGPNWFSYSSIPRKVYSVSHVFCEKNQGITFDVKLEFYNEL